MVNLQLPISHIIITSKTSSKFQMSSATSHEKQKDKNRLHAAHKIESLQQPFKKGSVIQLGNGQMKKVEELSTEDFVKSASVTSEFSLEHSKLTRLVNWLSEHCPGTGSVLLSFLQRQEE